jgi:GAF domain-containing protein
LLEELIASVGTVARMDPKKVLGDSIDGADVARSWLGTLLTTLDRRAIGSIHLFERRPDAYTNEDEEVLVQLAQLGSAAIERVDVYARRSASPSSDPGPVREIGT